MLHRLCGWEFGLAPADEGKQLMFADETGLPFASAAREVGQTALPPLELLGQFPHRARVFVSEDLRRVSKGHHVSGSQGSNVIGHNLSNKRTVRFGAVG